MYVNIYNLDQALNYLKDAVDRNLVDAISASASIRPDICAEAKKTRDVLNDIYKILDNLVKGFIEADKKNLEMSNKLEKSSSIVTQLSSLKALEVTRAERATIRDFSQEEIQNTIGLALTSSEGNKPVTTDASASVDTTLGTSAGTSSDRPVATVQGIDTETIVNKGLGTSGIDQATTVAGISTGISITGDLGTSGTDQVSNEINVNTNSGVNGESNSGENKTTITDGYSMDTLTSRPTSDSSEKAQVEVGESKGTEGIDSSKLSGDASTADPTTVVLQSSASGNVTQLSEETDNNGNVKVVTPKSPKVDSDGIKAKDKPKNNVKTLLDRKRQKEYGFNRQGRIIKFYRFRYRIKAKANTNAFALNESKI